MKNPPALAQPVPGEVLTLDDSSTGRLAIFVAGPTGTTLNPPLVLVHTVNAAASAAEVKPIFERGRLSRPTYAFDLPGYGLSDRSDRPYTPRLMTDAVHACVRRARADHGGRRVDVLGASLGCEFVARAVAEDPGSFRSVALVSPTGFTGTRPRRGAPLSTRSVPGMHAFLAFRAWSQLLFGLLTRPAVIRYFLARTWGSPRIDEDLWAYDLITTRQRGARYAPLYFLSAGLFSADVTCLYEALTLPVWVSHGVRGDFVDYRGLAPFLDRPSWSLDVFQTGALPYFEMPDAFFASYERFLATLPSS